jgi:PAS domain S-box-containing protein
MSAPLSLLLVEDDHFDAYEFQRAIGKTTIEIKEIRVCKYAEDALETLKTWLPDCIFIDYQLPKTNGLELLKQVKTIVPLIPVIILTSQGDERIAVEMMKAGAMDYFPKSEINSEKLSKALHTMSQVIEVERKRAKTQRELNDKEELIDKIALLSPNIIYVIDIEKWANIFHNKQIWSILGYLENDFTPEQNSLFAELFNKQDKLAFLKHYDFVKHFVKDGQVIEKEFCLRHKNGSEVWIITREVPFRRNDAGEVQEVLGTAIDITQRKFVEKELLRAKKEAEDASRIKSDFLSTMSHEIRTPMNAIVGFTDLLLTSSLSGQEQEYLHTIKYSADNLMVILNDILDFSKIEAGKLQLENFEFDLTEKLAYLQKTFDVSARRKQIDLIFDIDQNVPVHVIGDPHRLNQILVNLLGNALKFTLEGFVRLSLQVITESANSVDLRFDIYDTGIGVPQDKLNLIFDSFSQAHQNDATKFFGGTGLGLSITKKITDLMNGRITARSELGKGSVFSVFLSFSKGTRPMEQLVARQVAGISLIGYRILVAEDILANQVLLKHVLKKSGADFVICNNGKEAIEELERQPFNLVLMDLQMPVMDGVTAMKRIRNSPSEYAKVPVIALTADTFAETVAEIAACSFRDFITKPFKADELIRKIALHVGAGAVA